uniref:Polycomb protein VEFS-Box domain-containing protein n=1 Tax=Phytophthora ramorum TaxID=164328 RepID=H3GCJ7_PHYRM
MADQGSSKRKRDESHDRKVPLTKERRTKVRQENMEEEFASTYHGLTALYKLLEVKHLESPLFLPRTLSYRLDPAWQQKAKAEVKGEMQQKQQKDTRTALATATLQEFKIGMTSDTMEAFKRQKQRPGVLISVFKADGKNFDDNQFTLLATSLIPVPFLKDVVLPEEYLHLNADICVLVFQVVEISDVSETLASQPSYTFAAPAVMTTVSGKNLLTTCANGRKPLFGNLLRLNVVRRRVGYVTVELPAIASSVHGGVKCEFRFTWAPLPKTKKMQRLARICEAKLKVEKDGDQNDESFMLAVPKRDITTGDAHKPCSGVWFLLLQTLFGAELLLTQHGAVVLDHEKDYDSDDDVDETWITKQSERLLDEFEDVSLEEKEFMKKWNRHVKEFRILADFMVASSCRMFAREQGKWLLDHGLRHNFLLHLLNLWDNSLLNSRAIIDCMLIVDQNQTKEHDKAPENGEKIVSPATTENHAKAESPAKEETPAKGETPASTAK